VRWVKALDGASFQVREGETFGLVGESGCGKSTLGKTILGIYRPTEGSVYFKGKEISRLPRKGAKEIRKDIQYVYQDPGASLDPYWKVGKICQSLWSFTRFFQARRSRKESMKCSATSV